jgi:hypothetical protein
MRNTKKGVLNMPRKYVRRLEESGDRDYEFLASLNGQEVEIFTPLQVAVSKRDLVTYVLDANMTIPAAYIKRIEK